MSCESSRRSRPRLRRQSPITLLIDIQRRRSLLRRRRLKARRPRVGGAVARWLVVVAQERQRVVGINSELLIARGLALATPAEAGELAEEPLASLKARVATVLLLGMGLLEEQDADDDAAQYDRGAHEVREQVRATSPDGVGGKRSRPAVVGLCQGAAQRGAQDRSEK